VGVELREEAFNRPGSWEADRRCAVALGLDEVTLLDGEIEALIRDCSVDIRAGFVVESPEKLRRITAHFRAHLGSGAAEAPLCNAPWVSAVIEADGAVRPCFFHPAFGNIHERPLREILNSPNALDFRKRLDVPNNPICRNCVCSLYLPPEKR
jgi:Fe-coproporphyrin III synthase